MGNTGFGYAGVDRVGRWGVYTKGCSLSMNLFDLYGKNVSLCTSFILFAHIVKPNDVHCICYVIKYLDGLVD